MSDGERATEVASELELFKSSFEKAGYETDYPMFETWVEEMLEQGTMTPRCGLTARRSLSLKERETGTAEFSIDVWLSIGVILGTALERDAPVDSERETMFRDGELTLPEVDSNA